MPTDAQIKAAALERAKQALADAQAEHDAATKEPAPPRTPDVVLHDILDEINMRLGNRPSMRALLAEFKAGTAPKS